MFELFLFLTDGRQQRHLLLHLQDIVTFKLYVRCADIKMAR